MGACGSRRNRLIGTGWVLLVMATLLAGPARWINPPTGHAAAGGVELVVSAAASLTDVLAEAREAFERLHPGISVRLNLASSGTLQRQIERGAPVDLFISASPDPVEALVARGDIEATSVAVFAENQLVLVRPTDRSEHLTGWGDLASPLTKGLAIGNPDHVPAGQYARALLQHLGLWDAVQTRLILGENVRQVLHYVGLGEVDAAIVYASDLASRGQEAHVDLNPRVVLVTEAPGASAPPIRYLLGVTTGARQPDAAASFAAFLLGPGGRELLARYGFTPLPTEP